MRYEFHKIIYSILVTIALNIVLRLITLVTISDVNQLHKAIDDAKTEADKTQQCKSFIKSSLPKLIIAGVLMLTLMIFFFYYAIMFCGIYVNTQDIWFYSGMWSLFMDWVIFAPVYIIILSVIEKTACSGACIFYAKQLFIF